MGYTGDTVKGVGFFDEGFLGFLFCLGGEGVGCCACYYTIGYGA